jgi:lactate dehydrogenase-like 2-hydroxyacid dehydrogenase
VSRFRILVARRVTEAVAARAGMEFDAVVPQRDLDAEETIALCNAHGIQGILTGGKVRLTAGNVGRLPDSLRIVANPTAGTDHMDVAATKARGIVVTNAPDAVTDCTADLAMLLLLAACRRAGEYATVMREGWRRPIGFPDMLGMKIGGKTLGIIGMGRIGRAVARRARAFGMTVLYHNRRRLDPALEDGAEHVPDLRTMLPRCQVLSLHLPGGEAGTLMTREMFALLPRGAVFVNTARGSLVDEEALLEALTSGRLFAAGLDVFRGEPDYDLRFRDLPNVFLTPHVASATEETRDAMGYRALDNIAAVLSGRPPLDPV